MSCGQEPGLDDICAADRLARLLNRAREEGAPTPRDTAATLQPCNPARQPPT